MRRVTAFVGTRADLSPLGPVLVELARRDDVDLTVLCAIGLTPASAPEALAGVGLHEDDHRLDVIDVQPADDAPGSLAAAGARLAAQVTERFTADIPDVLVVLGDRWELLWVVPTAVLLRVPVVHLHGGEVTEGALDERVRHAVTKLADVHAVATEPAYRRVRSLGESAAYVHLTGAPGLDRLAAAQPLTAEEFAATFGRELTRPLVLCTYHPVTGAPEDPGATAATVLDTLDGLGALTVVTDPGFDAGREDILAAITAREDRASLIHVPSLGPLYPRLLKTVDAVVGNSSSGIIEAPFVGAPTLDIGVRQSGRDRGPGVQWAAATPEAVREALAQVLDPGRARLDASDVYGHGDAAARIAQIVAGTSGARLKPFEQAGTMNDAE